MSHSFGMRCETHGLVVMTRCSECGENHGTTDVPHGPWCTGVMTAANRALSTQEKKVIE